MSVCPSVGVAVGSSIQTHTKCIGFQTFDLPHKGRRPSSWLAIPARSYDNRENAVIVNDDDVLSKENK